MSLCILLHLAHSLILTRWKVDVSDQQMRWLMDEGFALKDSPSVNGNLGPAILLHLV